ncbi:MAG: hypothetical protein OHK0046_31690 [Anaerolineae bacterium]
MTETPPQTEQDRPIPTTAPPPALAPTEAADDTAEARRVFETAQSFITAIVALGAVLSAGGFVVMGNFIARYGWLQTYDVSPGQYLAAGLGLVMFAMISVTLIGLVGLAIMRVRIRRQQKASPSAFPFVATGTVFYGLALLAAFVINLAQADEAWDSLTNVLLLIGSLSFFAFSLQAGLRQVAAKVESDQIERAINLLISATGVMIYILIVGSTYGQSIHPVVPRVFGGGEAFPVHVSVSSPEMLTALGVTLDSSGQSEPLCFLADVPNGAVLYSPLLDAIIVLKAEGAYFSLRNAPNADIDCFSRADSAATRGSTAEVTPEATAPAD